MNLQTQVRISSNQQECFKIMESGFPYLTVLGVLEVRGVCFNLQWYIDKYLQNNSGEDRGNFRMSVMEDIPWHWHEELEYCYIIKGKCIFCLPDNEFMLYEGDAVLINANCLHKIQRIDYKTEVVYHTHQFRKELMEGDIGSIFKSKYVDPLVQCSLVQGELFRSCDPEQKSVIDSMEKSYNTYLCGKDGYEIIIRSLISELWLYLLKVNRSNIEQAVKYPAVSNERIKTMMTYIELNYMDKISIEDIGRAANVSRRECLRCFKQNLHMSPFSYLTDMRIRKAAELLIDTKDSVIAISEACGFSSSSYFGKVFFKIMGCTPNEYRKSRIKS